MLHSATSSILSNAANYNRDFIIRVIKVYDKFPSDLIKYSVELNNDCQKYYQFSRVRYRKNKNWKKEELFSLTKPNTSKLNQLIEGHISELKPLNYSNKRPLTSTLLVSSRPDEFLSNRKIETQTSNKVSRFSVVNMAGNEPELMAAPSSLSIFHEPVIKGLITVRHYYLLTITSRHGWSLRAWPRQFAHAWHVILTVIIT